MNEKLSAHGKSHCCDKYSLHSFNFYDSMMLSFARSLLFDDERCLRLSSR